jgi:hypothetical protein
MQSAELLAQFRALGGTADNVRIGHGVRGRGLFVESPQKPVRVFVPLQVLIPPQMLELTPAGEVRVMAGSGCRPDVAAFHEQYQRCLGWGAGGATTTLQHYQALCGLPDPLKAFLRILGCPDSLARLPSHAEAWAAYCVSRQISVKGDSQLMPMLDLINHAPTGAPFVVGPQGVNLTGIFEDEIRACYRRQLDAFHFYFNYHFAAPSPVVLSCEVQVDIPHYKALRVSRLDGLSRTQGGVRVPRASTRAHELQLSYVELVNRDQPARPRQVFIQLLSEQGLSHSRAHALFDGLLEHNVHVFQSLSKACDSAKGQAAQDLKNLAGYQLDSLQHH